MKPLIGITGNIMQETEKNSNIKWHYSYSLQDFSQAVYQAGGIPVTLPLLDQNIAQEMINKVDGIIFSGGEDIHPLLYKQEVQPTLGPVNMERDRFELSLLDQAIQQQKAILGICRGFQLINVYFGGSLHQEIQQLDQIHLQHRQKSDLRQGHHLVRIDASSYLSTLIGSTSLVNSYHHQAIDQLASPLKATAYSSDHIIEAIEYIDQDHSLLAVQWHPEIQQAVDQEQAKLFENLVYRSQQSAR
ncbi:gamma-glutamyl-gamma-aminobutyrate hydrolase family protein [Ignavigranum ruoffiae]|uniref:gamma-glutamyl-gamma-aminobutyrate hydrolase family protein n=1 Tax=Ignavigranum ruoffiae TaxID=89093 RepID=UPI0024ACBA6C|nr:gamma-glutamyl-gamma-aminobutyrate hydrolase family protein [Ignavigranum ruoffiae]